MRGEGGELMRWRGYGTSVDLAVGVSSFGCAVMSIASS